MVIANLELREGNGGSRYLTIKGLILRQYYRKKPLETRRRIINHV